MFVELDYPREVLEIGMNGQRGFRRIVHNAQDLERYWKGKNGLGNVYFTAYGYRGTTPPKHHRVDYNTPIVRHFVLDFDCKDFKNKGRDVDFSFMHEQVKRLHKHLLRNEVKHYVWFSGGGFHFWIPIKDTILPNSGLEVSRIKTAGKKLISEWDKKLNISCCDPTVAFDFAGMIRIPNSYNFKRKCWSIPLTSDEILNLEYYDYLDDAQTPRVGYTDLVSNGKPLHLELPKKKVIVFKKKEEKRDMPDVSFGNMLVLPCLVQSALGEGNPIHKARFHLVNYLSSRLRWFLHPDTVTQEKKNEHIEKIVSICEAQGWVDFNKNITHTQVSSIVNGKYSLSSCKTLINEGLCSGICMYYDGTAGDVI